MADADGNVAVAEEMTRYIPAANFVPAPWQLTNLKTETIPDLMLPAQALDRVAVFIGVRPK